ncbi:aminotransferase class I/II-fold pyridoxal phosphate-dependent enzyme [Niabella pedocola]|uniref:Aminotransferase class I/II-fold pyridoxal phosphate-dependent enzyme n=1 Tax=Niabella pedocola TaxID=1752077 RepID=A0ABS8PSV3_9BACT|nr:aminotransferase class I/II-fold pyridoxal phosphate-dependent enzyme [Niabella pedocola]MCD2424147.1 aminotransferase class I/II-fold pyridoxal phosphate-dependent enzyme [Niabella pedocola]
MSPDQPQRFEDICSAAIHSIHDEGSLHSHAIPIYATSTFVFDSAEQGMNRFAATEPGYIYSRFANPTTTAAEKLIAALEAFGLKDAGGAALQLKALLHASGQGALSTLCFSLLKSGDIILTNIALYGGTHEFFAYLLAGLGIQTLFIDLSDLDAVEQALRQHPQIRLIHIESPTNPLMGCTDIAAVCKLAVPYGVKVSVDNTFATPYLQQPFALGVDFVYHSTTKFLNGHGTAIGGVLVGKDTDFMNTTATKTFKLLGANANAFDAFLLINGIKTLPLRMRQHSSNAQHVAEWLEAHPAVAKVNYNGLKAHPDYALSARQMRYPGAVLSFELAGGIAAGKQFINRLRMCTRAVSLGTVDTLISHPASMSHAIMKPEERLKAGITDGLIRMSVGIEAVEDILADLEQALSGLPV